MSIKHNHVHKIENWSLVGEDHSHEIIRPSLRKCGCADDVRHESGLFVVITLREEEQYFRELSKYFQTEVKRFINSPNLHAKDPDFEFKTDWLYTIIRDKNLELYAKAFFKARRDVEKERRRINKDKQLAEIDDLVFGTGPEFLDPAILKNLNKEALVLAKTVTEQMKETMLPVLNKSIVEGWGYNKTARVMSKELGNFSTWKSLRITRTETVKAVSAGTLEGYHKEGVAAAEFSTAGDACKICAPLNGRIFSLSRARGLIPVHPNCRCVWIPVLVDGATLNPIKPKIPIPKEILLPKNVKYLTEEVDIVYEFEGKSSHFIVPNKGKGFMSKKDMIDAGKNAKRAGIKSEINLMAADSSEQHGFIVPFNKRKDVMFIHNTNHLQDIDNLKAFTYRTPFSGNAPESVFETAKDLMKKGGDITNRELVEGTIFHEDGHLRTLKKLGNYADPNVGNFFENLATINDEFARYHTLAQQATFGGDTFKIGEMIAEDFRRAFARHAKHKSQFMPNKNSFAYDVASPSEATERQDIIFKMLGGA